MSGIAEAMAGMAGGGKKGRGISSHMEHHEPEHERDGEAGEHAEVRQHLESMHEKHGGKHMHIHQHEAGYTTHHIGEDGKVEGPHDHQNTEELKDHLGKFFDEEEHEGSEHAAPSHDGNLI